MLYISEVPLFSTYLYQCYYYSFCCSLKWVKDFVFRTRLVLMTLTNLLSITTKQRLRTERQFTEVPVAHQEVFLCRSDTTIKNRSGTEGKLFLRTFSTNCSHLSSHSTLYHPTLWNKVKKFLSQTQVTCNHKKQKQ